MMKLANALSQRGELQTRIRQLGARLNANALVQEGEHPAEDPRELMAELDDCYEKLEVLIRRINHTNAVTVVTEDRTLTDYLALRDCLAGKIEILRSFLTMASAKVSRHTVSEIRVKSTVQVRLEQKRLDDLAAQLRQVDELIQEKNWTTELI